ncbi:unnamed protein product [Dibothriocephalus latus]|uniref:Reverse transcriptase domain-containing protein n=1 Tax=Dibothriocephalus latus TaxID=60516 RepID=A0A3P7L1Y3_DIBLA|nr:unnamed protein product [Dibothriocephalus latus]
MDFLKKLSEGFLDERMFRCMHKEGAPLRPIVSLKGTPTYGLAKWLFRRLEFLISDAETTVRSSTQFLEKLKEDLVVETVDLLLRSKYDETANCLGHAEILQLLKFCLRTYFTFDGTIYEQVKGTPVGSPISGLIAEAVFPVVVISELSSPAVVPMIGVPVLPLPAFIPLVVVSELPGPAVVPMGEVPDRPLSISEPAPRAAMITHFACSVNVAN